MPVSCLKKFALTVGTESWQTGVGLQLCRWKERYQSHEAAGVSATYHT